MAATSKAAKLGKCFKEKLDQLGCPFTEGVDETWITEPLFKPGEPRIRLLQWLFSKFDSKLAEVLDPDYAPVGSKMDSRIQRLLDVASTLGLCRYDDVDLIRGVTSVSKQASFMTQLIDMVSIIDASEETTMAALQSPGVVSPSTGLTEQFGADCLLMDRLANQEKTEVLFNSRVSLLPLDLQRKLEVQWVEKGFNKDSPPAPDLPALTDLATQVTKDLHRQTEILTDFRQNHKHQASTENDQLDTMSRTLTVVLSELSQLMVSFTYCYENEMRHWCNKTPPSLTGLGKAFKRVHTILHQFHELLRSISQIRITYTQLGQESIDTETDHKVNSLVCASQSARDKFQEYISILEESLQRQES
ncbi:HAUS augmin-like complex subunit 7 [Haliotis asinina]|uniref:HAUS augmin-like complex subunit 7 n=1 Tax=Haliotis asinina TaxID=109174 RepID=UPI003531A1A5